jgi:hypothetical protein
MRDGLRTDAGHVTLAEARSTARSEIGRLPDDLRALQQNRIAYIPSLSAMLEIELRRLRNTINT